MYAISIEAIQAILAPIKFNKIKVKSLLFIFPTTISMYANSIWKTPINPIQSILFTCCF